MLDAAREAMSFAAGKDRGCLNTDRMLVLSLTKDIEIIGEAASKVSEETRNDCPDIPWSDVISMRNHLIHAYFDIDLDVLWSTIANDVPSLISALEKIVSRAE